MKYMFNALRCITFKLILKYVLNNIAANIDLFINDIEKIANLITIFKTYFTNIIAMAFSDVTHYTKHLQAHRKQHNSLNLLV